MIFGERIATNDRTNPRGRSVALSASVRAGQRFDEPDAASCRVRGASVQFRQRRGGLPGDAGVAAVHGGGRGLGQEVACSFEIAWTAAGGEHAAPPQVGGGSSEFHLTPGVELRCLGEVRLCFVVAAEYRLKTAAVIRHRAAGCRPDEENLVVERREQIEEQQCRCLGASSVATSAYEATAKIQTTS